MLDQTCWGYQDGDRGPVYRTPSLEAAREEAASRRRPGHPYRVLTWTESPKVEVEDGV